MESSAALQAIAVILASGLAVYLMVKQAKEMEEMQKRLNTSVRRVTVLSLPDGKKIERPYRDGDYVGKKVETEQGEAYIIGIYAERDSGEKKRRKR